MKIRLAMSEDAPYFEELERNPPEIMFAMETNPALPQMFLVAEDDTGAVAALYAVFNISDQHHSAELGTFAVQKGGFFQSLKPFTEFMFSKFPFHRLYTHVRGSNETMLKLLDNAELLCGIPVKLEGILRQAYHGPNGYEDLYLYAVLRDY